ncbi:MAG: cadherin-like beta sandwich domain-containing protein, partial [Treponema sp.]|nr:cadherin-like beta sandwich domain-containing protein [Treponema sp.]
QASSESRLSSLTFTKGKLDQQFHADITSYTLKVDASETIMRVIPAALNANITSLTVNGKAQSSGAASEDIIIAATPAITIVVTAENEHVISTYTITLQPVVNYSSAALSQFWISNMAEDDVEDVVAVINSGDSVGWLSLPDTTQLKFKPVLVNSNATIKLNGTAIAHNTYTGGYNLTPGVAITTFNFTVISEDGENERTFDVPCRYYGTQWEKVGDLPAGNMSYNPMAFTVVTHNDQFILTNTNEVFASADGTNWSKTFTFPDTMQHYLHSSVVYNNTIYNIGGVKKNGQGTWETANIVSYSTNGTMFTVASSVSGLTGGVQQHDSVVYNNKLYVIGGAGWYTANPAAENGFEYRDVWSSTNGTTWTQETASAEWTGRNDHTVNANSKGMWLFGGNDGYFKNDLWFSRDGKTWTKALDAPFAERATHAAVVRDGYLYVFGGVNGSWEEPNYLTDIWRTYIGE